MSNIQIKIICTTNNGGVRYSKSVPITKGKSFFILIYFAHNFNLLWYILSLLYLIP